MLYRHYHVQYTSNDKGERRWIVDQSDAIGESGFETLEEAKRYVNKLMKNQGKENQGFWSIYPDDYYIRD